MKRLNLIFIFIVMGVFTLIFMLSVNPREIEKPKVSFSFDDGLTRDFPNYTNDKWNLMLLNKLQDEHIKSILFVKGQNLDNQVGKNIMSSWNDSGHLIANHTYSHAYFNSDKISLDHFKQDLLKNDSLINAYSNFAKFFRFPYLKEGNTIDKRDGFRAFLKVNNYKIGHVTIDASDWYVNQRLVKRLEDNPDVDISGYKDYYLKHIFERAQYYNNLGTQLTGRQIHHNLLLHHNLTSALFIDDLIQHFRNNGWEIIDAEMAYKDPIYKAEPDIIPAGESLLWALAKEKGTYDAILRYPAEDSRYETSAMDSLDL